MGTLELKLDVNILVDTVTKLAMILLWKEAREGISPRHTIK